MFGLRSVFFGLVLQLVVAPLGQADSHSDVFGKRAAVNGNGCAAVTLGTGAVKTGIVTIPSITLARGVCICAVAGGLTPASLATISTQVTANQGILAPVINALGGITQTATRVAANTLPLVLAAAPPCVYPANSDPNSCGSCAYACSTGFKACGQLCIPTARGCRSGVPVRRRGLVQDLCPAAHEACMSPSTDEIAVFTGRNYECVDTDSDIESCGGCVYPLPGRATGVDCTAIAGVASVACISGQCVIEGCNKGHAFNGTACMLVEAVSSGSKRPLLGYWASLE